MHHWSELLHSLYHNDDRNFSWQRTADLHREEKTGNKKTDKQSLFVNLMAVADLLVAVFQMPIR